LRAARFRQFLDFSHRLAGLLIQTYAVIP